MHIEVDSGMTATMVPSTALPRAALDYSFSSVSDLLWTWDLLAIRKSQNITGCFQATLFSVGFSWIKRFEEHVKKNLSCMSVAAAVDNDAECWVMSHGHSHPQTASHIMRQIQEAVK